MSDEAKEKSKKLRHFDRVTLSGEALTRIDGWIAQVTSKNKGVSVSRKDYLNWFILQHPETLSDEEVSRLETQFFDEIRFLSQSLKEMRAARARGEVVDLSAVLKAKEAPAEGSRPRRQRRARSKKQMDTSGAPQDAPNQALEETLV